MLISQQKLEIPNLMICGSKWDYIEEPIPA
jgi:hypothetical protein